jgi:hypothetical protein
VSIPLAPRISVRHSESRPVVLGAVALDVAQHQHGLRVDSLDRCASAVEPQEFDLHCAAVVSHLSISHARGAGEALRLQWRGHAGQHEHNRRADRARQGRVDPLRVLQTVLAAPDEELQPRRRLLPHAADRRPEVAHGRLPWKIHAKPPPVRRAALNHLHLTRR